MSVYKRPETGLYYYDFILDGVRHRGPTKRTKKAEAQAVEAQVRAQLLNQQQLGSLPEITLREAVDLWWKDYGSRLGDASRIETTIRIMFEGADDANRQRKDRTYAAKRKWTWNGAKLCHKLTDADVTTFVNTRLREGVATNTIYQEQSIVTRTISRLKASYRMPTLNWPSSRDDKRLVRNAKCRYLMDEEIDLLLREVGRLRQQGTGDGMAAPGNPRDELPPHY